MNSTPEISMDPPVVYLDGKRYVFAWMATKLYAIAELPGDGLWSELLQFITVLERDHGWTLLQIHRQTSAGGKPLLKLFFWSNVR